MSRKDIAGCLVIACVFYYAVMIGLGFRTWNEAVRISLDAIWWSSIGLSLHWWVNRRKNHTSRT